MPRDGSGTYTLPAAAFVSGAVILSSDVNANFGDIAAALTGSIPADGQAGFTGQLKGDSGLTPPYTFSGDIDTGWASSPADTLLGRVGGASGLVINVSGVTTGIGSFSGTVTTGAALVLSTGDLTVNADGITVSSGDFSSTDRAIAGDLSVASIATFSTLSHMVPPGGTTAQRPSSPVAGFFRYNSTLGVTEFYNGTAWLSQYITTTMQVLTSGSGTYTTPAGCRQLYIRMVGGGAGGASEFAFDSEGGADGTNTTFDTVTAAAGDGADQAGGASGTGGTGGAGSASLRIAGGNGSGPTCTQDGFCGGQGGVSVFGGNGFGQLNQAGVNAKTNSGSGGSGAGDNAGTGAGGGGAGEYVEFLINNPAATYSYTVGAGGAGGTVPGQPSLAAGGNGGSGLIIVEEYY